MQRIYIENTQIRLQYESSVVLSPSVNGNYMSCQLAFRVLNINSIFDFQQVSFKF